VNPDYLPPEKFVAISKSGETGCAMMKGTRKPAMSVRTEKGYNKQEGNIVFPEK